MQNVHDLLTGVYTTCESSYAGGRGEFQSSFTDELADGLACNVSFCTFVEAGKQLHVG